MTTTLCHTHQPYTTLDSTILNCPLPTISQSTTPYLIFVKKAFKQSRNNLESVKESAKELVKESAKKLVKELVKESAKELVKESSKKLVKESSKELVNESSKELVKESSKELVKDSAKQLVKESSKESVKESSKKLVKDSPKEFHHKFIYLQRVIEFLDISHQFVDIIYKMSYI